MLLLIVGIFGWILPGADKGVEFFVVPDWWRLADARIWFDAATQVFFTFGLAYGGLITLSSRNKFNNNTLRYERNFSKSNIKFNFFFNFEEIP